ncbi:MAG: TIGR02679 domain-containing protein [Erysipelotrichaceae bacterium]|nr:TIGR02679 domain-containing protein [Solobacterium sp.]MDY2952180.1 TIGR02679 domain-containing protein [Erysipelotrichaceae bacterium]MCI6877236.1 TIGR02679 domain-containing protein [Solobacterium sp.]MDD7776479.1 TIGR02679 domain-containing protein [Solobacterium sp.]MDY3793848.1 TIGR02679 domain-containing protein [Erysipelotrichaceae bacterium]
MTGSQKWSAYLKTKQVKRLMIELKKKWISNGHLTGKITLNNISDEEKRDIEGIMGIHFSNSLNAKDFESAITQNTVFGDSDFKEILELYFGTKLITSKEKKLIKKNEDEFFFESLKKILDDINANSKLYDWLIDVQSSKNFGYKTIQRLRKSKPNDIITICSNVFKGINEVIQNQNIYSIAIFASKISGNPHFLDRNSGDGSTLFVSILAYIFKEDYPTDSKSWYELLEKANLIKDEIAGSLAIFNIHLIIKNTNHQGAEWCYKYKQPFMLAYCNLVNVDKATTDNNLVYVVENEMVFTTLQKEIKDNDIALICTSGQPSLTAQKLIELLVKGNNRIFYSGDIDPEGLGICERLWKKYPNNITPWLMNKNDYLASISNEEVSVQRLSLLDKIENPILKETSILLKENKKAAYQENMISTFIKHLLS